MKGLFSSDSLRKAAAFRPGLAAKATSVASGTTALPRAAFTRSSISPKFFVLEARAAVAFGAPLRQQSRKTARAVTGAFFSAVSTLLRETARVSR